MKYLLISDTHGRDLDELQSVLEEEEDPDVFVCCGDFDTMQNIRQVKELRTYFDTERSGAVVVPGNHDHALLANLDIMSRSMRAQGISMQMLHRELEENTELHAFVDALMELHEDEPSPHSRTFSIDPEQYGDTYAAIAVHAGLSGSLRDFPNAPEHIRDLWYRLLFEDDIRENVAAMEAHDLTVMLRGHDHRPEYMVKKNDEVYREIAERDGKTYTLDPDNPQIISLGAYYDGWYALLDTAHTDPTLTYKNI